MEPEDLPSAEPYTPIEIRCYFVRKRNALVVRGQFAPLFVDHYLHLAQNHLSLGQFQDAAMKDGLAAMVLHLASRPWTESHAWTLHFRRPLLNLFLAGDNATARVTGRVFDRDVKDSQQNLFFAQLQKKGMAEPRTSAIEFVGVNLFRAVEQFYDQSEQRLGRFFDLEDEDYVFISAQPQCDVDWLRSLNAEGAKALDEQEELSLLETRTYHFECGCHEKRIWEVLLPHCRDGVGDLFENNEFLVVSCRRCGAEYRVQREQFEAFVHARSKR